MENMETLAANMRHAARNNETVEIGGGLFGPQDMKDAARLIAAAPELLEALQECITDKSAYCIGNGSATDLGRRLAAINEVCRSAIAKATGA